ncbi:hypothetical protein Tco_1005973 [Tanacetum coccineum]|uniref:Uncharacterized protein n=1 Tax=Tanacetum coccineum TaxID=301880 RepID=A0ABQ5FGG4_9ASTR
MHQPWRTFAAIINRCIFGKTTRLDKLTLSRAQILWGMYHCKNVDFVELLWEDFAFQIDNHFSKKSMPYPRFTKIIINHFISQNKSISTRNMINLHTARDDSLLGTLKYVSKTEEHQVGAKEPKKARKFKKPASPKLKTILVSPKEPTKKPRNAKKDVPLTKKPATKPKPTEKKALVKADRGKGDGTDFKSGVPDEKQHKISDDDEDNTEDESDNDGNDDDDNDGNDDDGDNDDNDDDSDHKRTEFDRDKNPNLNQSSTKYEEEEENQHNVSQESGFEYIEEDAHMTLTAVHDIKKTEGPMQPLSSDFTDKLLNFQNTSPANNEIASLMDSTVRHEKPSGQTSSLFTVPITVIPEITSTFTTTIPPPHPFFNPLLQQATPTLTPTASEVTTSSLAIPDFAFVFRLIERVANLEKDLEEALADKREYIDLIGTPVRATIKEEVKTQLPHILLQAVSNFATPVIKRNVIESLEAAVLAKSSSQPKSTYEAAASLSEFKLTKILMDKMEEHKSYLRDD